jgi:hypothetical protein
VLNDVANMAERRAKGFDLNQILPEFFCGAFLDKNQGRVAPRLYA